MNTFSYAIISAIVTIQIKIYWWLEYFVASGRVPFVKTPKVLNQRWRQVPNQLSTRLLQGKKYQHLTHSHTMTPFDALGNKPFENNVGKGEIAHN